MNLRKPQIRLVIADDHRIFRDGLRCLLESDDRFKVVGEASDGAEAVRLARQLKPDILLLDLAMPKHSGFSALRELSARANAAPVRVILLAELHESREFWGHSVFLFFAGEKSLIAPSSHCRHASIRTLEERIISLGACGAFSIQPVLPSV